MAEIRLTSGDIALVDDEDADLVAPFVWRLQRGGSNKSLRYAVSKPELISMHRLILGVTDSTVFVDHINGDGLDNRRSNLRTATNSQNQQNRLRCACSSSPYRGVVWHRKRQRWQAQLKLDGRNLYLGVYTDEKSAAQAYDAAARQHFGEFARLNFPSDQERAA